MAFNTTNNTSVLTTYLVKKFLPALANELQMQKFTNKVQIPTGGGKVGRFTTFPRASGTVTALTEGTTTGNEHSTLTTTATEVTIAEYGNFVTYTRLSDIASQAGTRDGIANWASRQAAVTIEKLVQLALSGTSTYLAAGQTAVDTAAGTADLSAQDIVVATQKLRDNGAPGFMGVEGHTDGNYAAFIDPLSEQDMIIEATTSKNTWVEMNKHVPGLTGQGKIIKGLMGEIYGTSCYRNDVIESQTPVATVSGLGNYVVSDGSVGALTLGQADPQIYINGLNDSSAGNPYRNKLTVSWHSYYGAAAAGDINSRAIKVVGKA